MINFLAAINDDTFQRLKDNFRLVDPTDINSGYMQNDLTEAERNKLRAFVGDHWKTPDLGGTTYHILSFYVEDIKAANGTDNFYIDYLTTKWPNKIVILGAWYRSGLQYGTSWVPPVNDIVFDAEGEPILVEVTPGYITGTPTYPVHPQILKIMPDDVTYDAGGNETSRTAATVPKEVNNLLGWSPRIWT